MGRPRSRKSVQVQKIKVNFTRHAAIIRRGSASYGGRGCEETDCIRREALLRNVKLFACGKSEALDCASKDMIRTTDISQKTTDGGVSRPISRLAALASRVTYVSMLPALLACKTRHCRTIHPPIESFVF